MGGMGGPRPQNRCGLEANIDNSPGPRFGGSYGPMGTQVGQAWAWVETVNGTGEFQLLWRDELMMN